MSALTALMRPRSAMEQSLARTSQINNEHIADLGNFAIGEFASIALEQSDLTMKLHHERAKRKELKGRLKAIEEKLSKISELSPGYGPTMGDLHEAEKRLREEQEMSQRQLQHQFVRHAEIQSVVLRMEMRLDHQERHLNEVEASFVENCSSSPTAIQAPLSMLLEGQRQIMAKLEEREVQLPVLVQRPSPETSTAVLEESTNIKDKSKPQ